MKVSLTRKPLKKEVLIALMLRALLILLSNVLLASARFSLSVNASPSLTDKS
ncbi:hypothetical protein NAI77_07295 [Francisella tularensis subsp. holarctica]|nr:hypothetical protein [Francisella tularensis]MDE4937793.1 hypothetical protein [Francisella tularensis subsp. holarctica]MDE4942147.1 hypothetical protein [Francisella tularensis subsp. holarctica]MDE4946492.1 hypothetical protein [Francisella tularensis subsp. holarctica]MDE4965090.1 hypothetical protein [Francisella tularensis subsp. holarctica]MDE4977604.1 hypothetical protein [Francisella tularensis subsp. holarctica]